MLWENIHKSASFDRAAKAIVAYGPEKVAKKFREALQVRPNGCWSLDTYTLSTGYVAMRVGDAANCLGHRISWLLHGQDLTPGLVVDHKCNFRPCVNPAHLRELGRVENMQISPLANKHKKNCPKGHEYDHKNTYFFPNGKGRGCRACNRIASAKKRLTAKGAK